MVIYRMVGFLVSLSIFGISAAAQQAGTVHVQIRHEVSVDPSLTVKRWDYLISEIAFKPVNSPDWIQSEDWFGFVSATKADGQTFELTGVPLGGIEKMRFQVGLNVEANAADPNAWPPRHALNPTVNGLQWEWQGGYIFTALEGLFGDEDEGFSYHLARDGNAVVIELPVDFVLKRGATIRLLADVNSILSEENVWPGRDETSTHSRDGDLVLPKLKAGLKQAFSVQSIVPDLFQAEVAGGDEVSRVFADLGLVPVTRRFPQVEFPKDNPLTRAGISLGRQLFHDTVLSKGNLQSCASCHDSNLAFSDGKRVSAGVDGTLGKRNSMPLFNLAWADSFFWDGRVKSLREQVLHPIVDPTEMGESLDNVVAKLSADPEFRNGFKDAFGDSEITQERIALAFEQFLLTLVSQDSKFDRAARGEVTLTDSERRGLELFVTEYDPANAKFGADCFHCHGGNLFVSKPFANNGLDSDFTLDSGRGGFSGESQEMGLFKVPSLRNVEVTGPFMHDGRFETLEEVIEHYNSGVKRSETLDPNLAKHPVGGLNLTEKDKTALIDFLKTLTDPAFINIEQNAVESDGSCNGFFGMGTIIKK